MSVTDTRLPRLGHPIAPAGFGPCGSKWRNSAVEFKHRMHAHLSVPFDRLFGPRSEPAFGVLTYHRVAPVRRLERTPLNVQPSVFRRQLDGLLRRGFEAWPLRRVLARQDAREEIPSNVFVVVFDDGYENVYRHAWPVLKQLSVPASIFLATGYLNSNEPCSFDDWGIARKHLGPGFWRPLTTSQCREMHESGLIDIGTHTHGHQDFRGHPQIFRSDLERSLDWLRTHLGLRDATFSYPYGFHDAAMREVVRDLPLLCGLTAECGLIRSDDDPYRWRRMGAENWDTPGTLAAKLNGWHSHLQYLWRRWRLRRSNEGATT